VIDHYCVSCHNQKLRTGGLTLDTIDPSKPSAHAEVWEKVVRKLRMRLMPPPGRPRPDEATYDALAIWLEQTIDRGAAARPNPGRTAAVHRLNRSEFQNAIRDLLGLDVDVASLFPVEPATFGLDNIADVLSISPGLMARYMSAARTISRLAVGLKPPVPVVETYRPPATMKQDARLGEEFPLGSRGGLAFRKYFPTTGEYEIRVSLTVVGLDEDRRIFSQEPSLLDVRLDGARIKRFTVGGENQGNLTARFAVPAGSYQVSVSFVEALTEPDGVIRQRGRALSAQENDIVSPISEREVASVAIAGPYNDVAAADSASRRKIFVCRPIRGTDDEPCARTILSALARRAYRRPVTEAVVQSLLGFYKTGRNEASFDDGIQFALERLLVDPSFLFRIERDPQAARANIPYQITDLELASRLSFFLWSSIPDETLLDLAAKGRLHESRMLARQARRLLADPRANALVDNFFEQWLDLRVLRSLEPDRVAFPDFDKNLQTALQREMELFLRSQLAEDRSVMELLTANYTFVNERLARHYRIPNVYGSEFRRVTFSEDNPRIGLLGKGGILAVTSYPNRTSPVLRGKWVIANLLGTPPPDPPPNVPGLKDAGATGQPASVRERLEQHRKISVCATCHAQFDPLGLALENFDATGAWRTEDAGTQIDASAAMPGTSPFQGPAGLRQFLASHSEQVVGAVTEKLLAYALGRRTEYYDRPTIRQIVRDAKANDYRWSSIILGIVKSAAFRMRMPPSAESASLRARSF